MGTITLNEKQRRRCEIITRLIANKLSSSEASELLGRSSRQVRRIRQRYEAQGLETLVHGNQGRPSPQRTKPALIEQLRELAGATGRYHDFNISFRGRFLNRGPDLSSGYSAGHLETGDVLINVCELCSSGSHAMFSGSQVGHATNPTAETESTSRFNGISI